MTATKLDIFTHAYVMAALWTFDDDAPSGEYSTSGRFETLFPLLADETIERMISDCARFQSENHRLICPGMVRNDEMAGHDFSLTRNRHGSGFWDHDYWADEVGKALTDAAHSYGEFNLYFGDDGKIYA